MLRPRAALLFNRHNVVLTIGRGFGIIGSMKTEKDDSEILQDGAEFCAPETAATRGGRRRKNNRTIKRSVQSRMSLNYLLFAVVLLVILWSTFFIFLFSIYGRLLITDFRGTGREASASFPFRTDDASVKYYLDRMKQLARRDGVSVAVLDIDADGRPSVLYSIDSMGNSNDESGEALDIMLSEMEIDAVFSSGEPAVADTSIGSYMFFGSKHEVYTGAGEKATKYLLLVKPFAIFNTQTMPIIYTLIFGTLTVLLLAALFSFFASKFQTKRLVDFSQKAKRLASGDFNVVFSGGGYEEYDNLAHALNSAKDELQKTEKMQRDIIANISHDIRTPLTMIKGYAEMIRDMPLDGEKRASTAGVIISETDRLTTLVGDVLSYSKLSSGVTEFTFEDCDLSAIAKSVLDRFDIFVERDGVIFETDIDAHATSRCDKARLEQVFYNLLGNAIT